MMPFIYKTLKERNKFEWGLNCQQAFSKLKIFFDIIVLIGVHKQGETLHLYFTVINEIDLVHFDFYSFFP